MPSISRGPDSGTPDTAYRVSSKHHSALPMGKPPQASTDSLGTFDDAVNEEMEGAAAADDLPPLQLQGQGNGESNGLDPIMEDDPASYDLVAPPPAQGSEFSLEKRSQLLFSREHLRAIFAEPSTLLKFTAFLSSSRPSSVPMLIYYLDALKALRAIKYANAIAEALEPISGHNFTERTPDTTANSVLEQKASNAFDVLVKEDLPAFITHQYIQVVSASITMRITGTMAPHLKEASEGLAEVFCLTDPSRADNPIVFASEVGIIALTFNSRRDGSPFMNLLMCAPLCDSRGKIRYFIGAQVDVSGLVKDCTDMDGMARILEEREERERTGEIEGAKGDMPHTAIDGGKDEFQALSEMLNMGEISTVRKHGGRMHRESQDDASSITSGLQRPRLLLKEPSNEVPSELLAPSPANGSSQTASGRLSGVYQHYLLVRPYPSLRILFASPSQRIPGVLQSHFLDRIGGSARVREELVTALAEGRGVTAKVRWLTLNDEEGGSRWIHCTPLLGSNGSVGVWMVVIVNDEKGGQPVRRGRTAPPVTLAAASRMPNAAVAGRRGINGTSAIANGVGDGESDDGDSLYKPRSRNRVRIDNGYPSHTHAYGSGGLPVRSNGQMSDSGSRQGSVSSLRI
ncbi:MAG: hypothetical protein Q9227_005346 [Pyrenula ochraceoflavens]